MCNFINVLRSFFSNLISLLDKRYLSFSFFLSFSSFFFLFLFFLSFLSFFLSSFFSFFSCSFFLLLSFFLFFLLSFLSFKILDHFHKSKQKKQFSTLITIRHINNWILRIMPEDWSNDAENSACNPRNKLNVNVILNVKACH